MLAKIWIYLIFCKLFLAHPVYFSKVPDNQIIIKTSRTSKASYRTTNEPHRRTNEPRRTTNEPYRRTNEPYSLTNRPYMMTTEPYSLTNDAHSKTNASYMAQNELNRIKNESYGLSNHSYRMQNAPFRENKKGISIASATSNRTIQNHQLIFPSTSTFLHLDISSISKSAKTFGLSLMTLTFSLNALNNEINFWSSTSFENTTLKKSD